MSLTLCGLVRRAWVMGSSGNRMMAISPVEIGGDKI